MTIRERFQCWRARVRSNSGSAAIEFAFVAPIFFCLMLGTFEASVMFFSQSVLQNAVTDMARQVRTGQVTAAGMTKDQFRTNICNAVSPLIACDSNLQIDVEAFPTGYGSVAYTTPLKSDNTLDTTLNNYVTGNACDVVLVRAFYTWSVVTPVLSWFLVNMAGNKHLVSAAATFRNEPFNNAGGC